MHKSLEQREKEIIKEVKVDVIKEVPKEVVEVLKNAQVKLQDCLDCVYEDRDPPNESDCLAADRTHTLAKLMNNNTVAQLEAIFDFEGQDAFGEDIVRLDLVREIWHLL